MRNNAGTTARTCSGTCTCCAWSGGPSHGNGCSSPASDPNPSHSWPLATSGSPISLFPLAHATQHEHTHTHARALFRITMCVLCSVSWIQDLLGSPSADQRGLLFGGVWRLQRARARSLLREHERRCLRPHSLVRLRAPPSPFLTSPPASLVWLPPWLPPPPPFLLDMRGSSSLPPSPYGCRIGDRRQRLRRSGVQSAHPGHAPQTVLATLLHPSHIHMRVAAGGCWW